MAGAPTQYGLERPSHDEKVGIFSQPPDLRGREGAGD